VNEKERTSRLESGALAIKSLLTLGVSFRRSRRRLKPLARYAGLTLFRSASILRNPLPVCPFPVAHESGVRHHPSVVLGLVSGGPNRTLATPLMSPLSSPGDSRVTREISCLYRIIFPLNSLDNL